MKMVISVGANLGDPIESVRSAINEIQKTFKVMATSNLYRTAPIGGPEQDHFINAILIIETTQEPIEVLRTLHGIETNYGRVREQLWGPRTLDLDLIEAGQISTDPDCQLPHPRAHERAFVLIPWLEVDPEAEISGLGKVREIEMPDQEVERV